jgi:hypothetical protein
MDCSHKNKAERLRFFSNAEYKSFDRAAPKWAFHIEQLCADCGLHLSFLKQDKALIEGLNGRLLIENFLEGRAQILEEINRTMP